MRARARRRALPSRHRGQRRARIGPPVEHGAQPPWAHVGEAGERRRRHLCGRRAGRRRAHGTSSRRSGGERDMAFADLGASLEIGERARDAPHPRRAAAGERVVPDRPPPRVVGVLGQRDQLGRRAGGDARVPAPRPACVARLLAGDGLGDTVAHRGRRLTGPVARLGWVHLEAQVEAVEQRRRQAGGGSARAASRCSGSSAHPDRTGTGSCTRRAGSRPGTRATSPGARCARRAPRAAGAARRARCGGNSPSSSRNSAPAVRERDLAGRGAAAAAADERGRRRGVVRRAERPRRAQTVPRIGMPGGGVDARDLERLVGVERRQDRRQPAGEHRLAGARRPDEQQVVPAGGGDLERAARATASPRTSARSTGSSSRSRLGALGAADRRRLRPRPRPSGTRAARASERADAHVARRARARPRRRSAAGTIDRARPGGASASTSASVPGTGRTEPSRPSSPSTPTLVEHAGRELVRRRRCRPSATASSRPGSGLAHAARREVDRDALHAGHSSCDDSSAARTRSRDSRTAASGSPTT